MKIAAMLGVTGLMVAGLAQAETVNLTWVPISENPATAGVNSTAHGTMTLSISPWTLTPISGNGLGPNYFTSGSAVAATITGISYTAGDGQTIDSLADLSSTTFSSRIWTTSGIDKPATGAQAPAAPPAGYYLTTAFSASGHTDQGASVMFSNNAGTAGANFGDGIHASGIGNGGVTDGAFGSSRGIADGGYWEVTPVPLPAGLPLLLTGFSAFGLFGSSKRRSVGADL
jgi:hypothetical protein